VSFVICTNLATHFFCVEAKVVEDLLEAERSKADNFSNEIQKLQKDVEILSARAQQSLEKEKALADRCKEQVVLLSFVPFSSCSFLISVIRNGNFNMPLPLLVTLERRRINCSASFENCRNKCKVTIV
jgi:hypothetical protein